MDLAQLDQTTAQRLIDKTKWLASNVGNLRHEALSPELAGLSQYAVGEWRIFYSIDHAGQVMDVHLIAHRQTLHEPHGHGSKI